MKKNWYLNSQNDSTCKDVNSTQLKKNCISHMKIVIIWNNFVTECDDGYYSSMCRVRCGHCAHNDICHKDSGYCPGGCVKNYKFPFCQGTCNVKPQTCAEFKDYFPKHENAPSNLR